MNNPLRRRTVLLLGTLLLLSGCGSSPASTASALPSLELPEIRVTASASGEELTAEVPITEVPSVETPATEALSTEAPTTAAPATEAPTTAAPATEAPTTAAPATKAPTTAAPATEAPTTAAPATEAPTTAAPATEAPTTAAPATEAPTTAAPATEAPASDPAFLSLLSQAGLSENSLSGSQMITVRSSGTSCTISFYEKKDGVWKAAAGMPAEAAGYVGRKGVGTPKEGSEKTPVGCFALGPAFGKEASPGIRMDYFQIREYDVWVDDPQSPHYNQHVDSREVNDYSSAEDLYRYMQNGQYTYGVFIRYNCDPAIPGNGSAFFLHVQSRPTAGCVGTSESTMKKVFAWLDEDLDPHILIV